MTKEMLKKETYWKTLFGIPLYKIDWHYKRFLYKSLGFTFGKMKEQRTYWNSRGSVYYEEFFDTDCDKYELFFQDLLIQELRQLDFSSIFEAGCGFGWNVKRIKREFPQANIFGIDFSLPQLKNSRKYQPDIVMPVAQADACRMPLKDKSVDIGFTMGVFMNIHPRMIDSAIDNLIRVCRRHIIHIEWDQDNTTPALRERRIFKTNIVSHDYPALYKQRGKKIIKFLGYKDFQDPFFKRFPKTKVKTWEQFDGPEKYILSVIEV